MTIRELKQKLDEYPDDYEIYIERSQLRKYPGQSLYKTNLILNPTEYNKRIYIQ